MEDVEAEVGRLMDLVVRDRILDGMGRCTLAKGVHCARYIVGRGLKCGVEIGVYRGSSLLAIAAAFCRTGGVVVGIDPWNNVDAAEKMPPSAAIGVAVEEFLARQPLEPLMVALSDTLAAERLGNVATLLRGRSQDVVDLVPLHIDFLHIDGNHDFERVSFDISAYVPRVVPGGIIVMDDTDWPSVRSCTNMLVQQGATLLEDMGTYQVWQRSVAQSSVNGK